MSLTDTFKRLKLFLAIITLFVDFQYVFGQDLASGDNTEDWILKLYGKYKEAVLDETAGDKPGRRFSDGSKQYNLHVEKLKEVNGFKKHNLVIHKKSKSNGDSEMIYIVNPIESRLPHPYMALEEFKEALLKRSEKNRITEGPTKNFSSNSFTSKATKLVQYRTNKSLNDITKVKSTKSVVTETSSLKPTRTSPTIDKITTLQEESTTLFVDTTNSYITKVKSSTTSKQPIKSAFSEDIRETQTTNFIINNHTVEESVKKNASDSITTDITDNKVTDVDSTKETKISATNLELILSSTTSKQAIKRAFSEEIRETQTTNFIINNHTVEDSVKKNASDSITTDITDNKVTDVESTKETKGATNLELILEANSTETVNHSDTTKVTELSTVQTPVENATESNNTDVFDAKIANVDNTAVGTEIQTTQEAVTTVTVTPEVKTTLARPKYYRNSRRMTKATTRKKMTRRTLGKPMVFMNTG